MHIKELQKHWHEFGKIDPCWAILTWSNKKGNQWQSDEFFRIGAIEIEAVLKSIETLGIKVKRGKALDFGCGVGRLTQALSHYFDETHGVDISPSMIQLARNYNVHNDKCIFHLNKTTDLKLFSDQKFDFIYTSLVLQHMDPLYAKKYIKEFLSVLAPHGLLVFQLPEPLNQYSEKLSNRLKILIKSVIPEGFLWFYRNIRISDKTKCHEFPSIEMHGIKQEDVLKLLQDNRGHIIAVRDYIEGMVKFLRDNKARFLDVIDTMPEEIRLLIEGYQPADITADEHFRYGVSFWYYVTKD